MRAFKTTRASSRRRRSRVDPRPASEATLVELAELFKVFGDHTRISILYALFGGERCVHELAGLLGMSASAISHQLRILKQAHLARFRKQGKTVIYSLDDHHVAQILYQALFHLEEEP